MTSIAKPIARGFHLPTLRLPRLWTSHKKQRQTTMDLIHSSPHLRRDIGLLEENFHGRGR